MPVFALPDLCLPGPRIDVSKGWWPWPCSRCVEALLQGRDWDWEEFGSLGMKCLLHVAWGDQRYGSSFFFICTDPFTILKGLWKITCKFKSMSSKMSSESTIKLDPGLNRPRSLNLISLLIFSYLPLLLDMAMLFTLLMKCSRVKNWSLLKIWTHREAKEVQRVPFLHWEHHQGPQHMAVLTAHPPTAIRDKLAVLRWDSYVFPSLLTLPDT